MLKVLIACEESQRVCTAFRELGHEAYSADIQEPSGGHPEWHILGDVLPILNGGEFTTMNGEPHNIGKWDIIIAHPPCTYLSFAGYKYLNVEKYGDKARERIQLREEAYNFAMACYNANCEHICIENPKGYINQKFRSPDCIINPFDFGEPARKRTCLWLKGLPPLMPTYQIPPTAPTRIGKDGKARYFTDSIRNQKARSKTFKGIAEAMAEQFTNNFYVQGQI